MNFFSDQSLFLLKRIESFFSRSSSKAFGLLQAILFLPYIMSGQLDVLSPASVSPYIVPSGVTSITVKIWGAGGGSGGHGTASVTNGGTGGTSTFGTLTSNGGAGSNGALNNTPTPGGAGGTASGGTINTVGASGGLGSVSGTSKAGDGGASPYGGATVTGPIANGNSSVAGIVGNPPGGGAAGSASGANPNDRRSTGGGGGGGYSEATLAVTPGQMITFTVGIGGTAGAGNQEPGALGANGRIEVSYNSTCSAPSIITNPTNPTIIYGNNTSLTVSALGTGPLNYTWRENGIVLSESEVYSGVNTATLSLNIPGVVLNGKVYTCFVSNACGNATSAGFPGNGVLTVNALSLIGNFTADNKVYDGTNIATVLTRTLATPVMGDEVSLTGGTAAFSDKNVANGKTVTLVGAILSGADSDNYSLSSVNTTMANITTFSLEGSFTADSKVYDGNNIATVLTRTLATPVMGDEVSLTGGTAAFSDKNVANGKTVTLVGASLSGADSDNYSLSSVNTNISNITLATATVTAQTDTKVYDGNTTSLVAPLVTGLISPDEVGTMPIQTFDNKNVSIDKTITASGLVINDELNVDVTSNYNVIYNSDETGLITIAELTILANDQTKCEGTNFTFIGDEFTVVPPLLSNLDNITSVTLASTASGLGGEALMTPYPIVPSNAVGTGLSNYNITYENGSFAVNGPAVVTRNNHCFDTVADALASGSGDIIVHSDHNEGGVLIIPSGITLIINQGVTYTNTGTITNKGSISNNGSFFNHGLFKGRGLVIGGFINNGRFKPGD